MTHFFKSDKFFHSLARTRREKDTDTMKKKIYRVRAAYTTKSEENNNLQHLVQIADKRVEVITLGNSSVGKTQLLSRFANNTFEDVRNLDFTLTSLQ